MTSLRAYPPPGQPDAGNGQGPQLALRPLSKAPRPAPLTYLLAARVPFGCYTGLQGDPGVGKSLLTCALAAGVTGRLKLPGMKRRRNYGKALILTREDDEARDLVPRIEALGGDPDLIVSLTDHGKPLPWDFDLWGHLDELQSLIVQQRVKLVVFDPITGLLPHGSDLAQERVVRPALEALAGVAMRTGAAFVGLRHLRKSRSANVVDPGIGSIAFFAVPRCVLVCDKLADRPGLYGMEALKCNHGAKPPALLYRIEDAAGVGRIRFEGEDELVGQHLGGVQPDDAEQVHADHATQLLLEMGTGQWHSWESILKRAHQNEITVRTIRSRKKPMGIKHRFSGQVGNRSLEWFIPKQL